MPPVYDDDDGLLWQEKPPEKTVRGKVPASARSLPSLPAAAAAWSPPTEFPSLASAKRITIDVETNDKSLGEGKGPGVRRGGYIVGVAVGTDDGYKNYFPVRHEPGGNLEPDKVFGWLREELSRANQEKLGTNLLYDLDYLAQEGVEVKGRLRDVQVAEPLLDETAFEYNLEVLGRKHVGQGKVEDAMSQWLRDAFGEDENIKANIWRAPPGVVAEYAMGDVDLPERIYQKQLVALEAEGLSELHDMESDLIPMLLAMRRRGVRVDLEGADRLHGRFEEEYKTSLEKVKAISGVNIDIWAPDSIAKAFDSLSLPYGKTAKTGKPSFTKDWLKHHPHPIAKAIMAARAVDKFKGTFLEGYILDGHVNGRIHTLFHQLKGDTNGTVSGRFSSSLPNLQNIPIRDPIFGPMIRALFLPEEGQQWWKFDWSQVEYRIMVHYGLLMGLRGADAAGRAYQEDPNTDFHQMVADLTGLNRKDAKNLNFGLAYNMGLPSLADTLGVDIARAEQLLNEYHSRSPFLKELMNTATRQANLNGFIYTLLKRKRRFNRWENKKWDKHKREWIGEESDVPKPGFKRAHTHAAGNGLIQGSAADVMKKAMVTSWKAGVYDVLGAPHLTVHDELDGSKDGSKASDEALAELKNIMETCVSLRVPLIADGGVGPNWGSIE